MPEATLVSVWSWHSLLHAVVVKAFAACATPALTRSGLMRPATGEERGRREHDGPREE